MERETRVTISPLVAVLDRTRPITIPSVDTVQRIAVATGLLWPRGSFPERTELPRRNGKRGW